jgi:HAMP domain-containing protein
VSTRASTVRPARIKASSARPKRRRGLRDARIRSKLALILVVPVIAIVSLAVTRLVDSGQRAVSAELVSSLTSLSNDVAATTQQLESERMLGAQYSAARNVKTNADAYTKQIAASNAAIDAYTTHRQQLHGVPDAAESRLEKIDLQLGTLSKLRQQVNSGQNITVSQVVLRYGVIIDDLVAYHGSLAQVSSDQTLTDGLRAMAAFAQAKDDASQEQALGFETLQSGAVTQEQYNPFVATLTGQQSELNAFELAATPDQKDLVDNSITGDAVQLATQVADDLTRSLNKTSIVTAPDFANAVGAEVDLMRWAEQRLDATLIQKANDLRASVIREVIIESVLVVITLIVAIAIAFLLARSMARALSRLREGALGVAERDLPEAVARLRDVHDIGENSPDEIARQVRDPIQIDSRDEIGQVGQAFNVVHREAVRVAAEQAALRTSVSAMFLNLARRSQALVDRMIGELDAIERSEEDPKRLAQLFDLDHLATRMRRNDENLLVLAGADSTAPRRDDALLADVVRAAQSEVELYNRIEFGTIDPDVSIGARAVNDVVRLLAELFDNATRFSPPNSSVLADARRIGDYVLIQVEDRGLGMSPDQMASLNARLAEPPSVDVAAFRMMGLAVVGRLADRYQIKVEMAPNPDGGIITHVTLPSSILILPRLRGREPVVTRPRAPLAVERGPAPAPANPPGWPMPQLPGLASAGSPAMTGAGVGTATLSGWAELSEARQDWTPVNQPVAPTVATPAVPVAGNGTVDALGAVAATRPKPAADETAELPIFRAMEAVWFRSHGHSATGNWPAVGGHGEPIQSGGSVMNGAPAMSGYVSAPPPVAPPPPPPPVQPPTVPSAYVSPQPPPVPPVHQSAPQTPPAGQYQAPGEESWRTAADDGWRAAAAAAEPSVSGTTRSGLPKRVPAAQLVPGGVDNRANAAKNRRTPDEVRGLLSAYHRGVQRGRSGADGSASNGQRPTDEERH